MHIFRMVFHGVSLVGFGVADIHYGLVQVPIGFDQFKETLSVGLVSCSVHSLDDGQFVIV